jgi:hypothetical protein
MLNSFTNQIFRVWCFRNNCTCRTSSRKREKKEAKEQRERVKKEELTEKLQEIRGLWKTPDEVDRKVKALSGDKKVKALQVQIMFRRHVLGTCRLGTFLPLLTFGIWPSLPVSIH